MEYKMEYKIEYKINNLTLYYTYNSIPDEDGKYIYKGIK